MAMRGRYAKGLERREEILRAAFGVLSREGYPKATLAQIGRAAGLETAHILYYFPTREDLLQDVLRAWDDENSQGDEAGDGLERWVAGVRRNMRNPGMVQLYTAFSAEAADATHPAHDFFRQRFAAIQRALAVEISRQQDEGRIRPEIDADMSASILLALSDGLQVRWLIDRSIDMSALLRSAIDALRAANSARRA